MMNYAAKKADDMTGLREPGHDRRPDDAAQSRTQHSETESMKAVTWQGTKSVKIKTVPKPVISHPKDVIVKVTACSICSGSDGHIYAGEMPTMDTDAIIGHEAMGIIIDKGPGVQKFNVGDRVVIAFDVACGECEFCKKEQYSACSTTNDNKLIEKMQGHAGSAIFGYSRLLGSVDGSQAEFVRVPYADVNCYPIPPTVSDEKALFMSDVLCTSLHACDMGNVKEGSTVAIFGLGPVGLCAARWCQILGAKRIVGIDMVKERLDIARDKLNIEVIDRSLVRTKQHHQQPQSKSNEQQLQQQQQQQQMGEQESTPTKQMGEKESTPTKLMGEKESTPTKLMGEKESTPTKLMGASREGQQQQQQQQQQQSGGMSEQEKIPSIPEQLKNMEPNGFDCIIEAVGFRFPTGLSHKIQRAIGLETDTPEILDECLTSLKPYGTLSIIGDYSGTTNGFPIGKVMFKHATVVSGQCPCQKYFKYVMEKLEDGSFDPSFMVSHHISFDEIPKAYEKLQNKEEGYIKVFVRP